MRLYGDLASWFHLLTAPEDYVVEAGRYRRLILEACPGAETLLELGSGGGNNAFHLKERFTCTLSDVSPQMLALSRSLNPECEHVLGDMRALRLGRTFDAVFVHDAVVYMTTREMLGDCIATAYAHTRNGGVAVFVPDYTRETFSPGTDHGGHDGSDGRALRFLEWVQDPDPADTTYEVDYAVIVREPGQEPRVVHDHHLEGLFPEHTWLHLLDRAGFEPTVDRGDPEDEDMSSTVFVARRPG
jgi:SAM-dependent methyltransferase